MWNWLKKGGRVKFKEYPTWLMISITKIGETRIRASWGMSGECGVMRRTKSGVIQRQPLLYSCTRECNVFWTTKTEFPILNSYLQFGFLTSLHGCIQLNLSSAVPKSLDQEKLYIPWPRQLVILSSALGAAARSSEHRSREALARRKGDAGKPLSSSRFQISQNENFYN